MPIYLYLFQKKKTLIHGSFRDTAVRFNVKSGVMVGNRLCDIHCTAFASYKHLPACMFVCILMFTATNVLVYECSLKRGIGFESVRCTSVWTPSICICVCVTVGACLLLFLPFLQSKYQ